MKRYLIYLSSLVALFGLVATIAISPKAAAFDTNDGHAHAVLILTNTSSPGSFKVSGKLGNGTSISFSRDGGEFTSQAIPGAGACGGTDAEKKNLQLNVTISGGNQDLPNIIYDTFCNSQTQSVTKTVTVPSAGHEIKTASFAGSSIQYKGEDGKMHNIGKDSDGSLTGPDGSNSQTHRLTFNGDGSIAKVSGLQPGTYKLSINYPVAGGQNQNYTKTIVLKSGEDYKLNGAIAGNAVTPGNGEDPNGEQDPETKLGCEATYDNPLTWIMCPIIDTLSTMIEGLDRIITNYLNVNTDSIFKSGETADAYHQAWQAFRNIALGLMVIVGLFIVISQALGLEILDAYTIRKTLPRLLIAAIGITLSWQIMQFLIDASNALGFGIRRLIYLPFANLKDSIDLSFGGGIWNLIGGTAATAGAAAAAVPLWIAAGGIGVVFSYVGTAALAVMIAILVLVLRQIAIILLMLLSPLAIIAYVLPNTQKLYKFWWESFSKALLMFPLIAGFIATGRVFSAVAVHNSIGGGSAAAINQLIGFIAYFAPYFLIPMTFKFAGGFVRQLGGFVNDRGRGAFDGLRNYRKGQAKQRIHAARTGGLYRNEYGEFFNPLTGRKTSVGKLANMMGNALDADEVAPYWLGRAGVPGFRRTPRLVDEALASQGVEHSANLAKKLGWHYETAWGVLGKREDEHGQGLKWSDNTERRLRQEGFYGEEARRRPTDFSIGSWQAPTGDVGAQRLASILQQDDSSEAARRAGVNLAASAEKLGTFKGDDETRRADIETAALMTAGSQGRLEDSDYVRTYEDAMDAPGLYPGYNQRFAAKRMKAILDMSQGQRVEQRDGKLISIDEAGHAYSVFDSDHRTWGVDHSRSYSADAPAEYANNSVLVPSAAAITNVETQKGQALMSAKGETVARDAETIAYLAGAGQDPASLSVEQKSWKQQIQMGIANSYSDAGSRKEWMRVARMAGLSDTEIGKATGETGPIDPAILAALEAAKAGPADPAI